jgi:hypothetical protein
MTRRCYVPCLAAYTSILKTEAVGCFETSMLLPVYTDTHPEGEVSTF